MQHILESHAPDLKSYEELYRDLHRNPELSCQETRTSSIAADHLEGTGFKVHRNIGRHGAAGTFENGAGRTVLLRADMDALPVFEETGVPYASRKRMKDSGGVERPVMHACGHDTHIVSLLAAAELLISAKAAWRGTLICVLQPNEELGGGAQAMVDDGLYNKVPKPDVLLGQHVIPMKSGSLAVRPGPTLSEASTLNVRIHGRGGHGSRPQTCIDPIMIAAYILVRLQSIVSREVNPEENVVVTCGSIHGGQAANIIPEEVSLGINVRTYSESVHQSVLESIKKIVRHECEIGGCDREPSIEMANHFPLTSNDKDLTEKIMATFADYFKDNFWELNHYTASEDFSRLATAANAPYVYWAFGGAEAGEWEAKNVANELWKLPGNHSSKFAPVIQPTLQTGMRALSLAALTFLENSSSKVSK